MLPGEEFSLHLSGYTVHRPRHWVVAGTDLSVGDVFGTDLIVVGYEADGCELAWIDGQLVPTGADGTPEEFEILATSPARLWSSSTENGSDLPPSLEHPTAHGLDPIPDRDIKTITRNILDRFGA